MFQDPHLLVYDHSSGHYLLQQSADSHFLLVKTTTIPTTLCTSLLFLSNILLLTFGQNYDNKWVGINDLYLYKEVQVTAKERIVRLFLDFVGTFVPLNEARLATLGGEGLEAKMWLELGIPKEHGWLIERSDARMLRLIAESRYRIHNQLSTFARILRGQNGETASIDGFHLDLCGTFGGELLGNFSSVMPLVLRSRGRSLAITVADQRRNLALEEWPTYEKRAERLFGKEAKSLYHTIFEQQKLVPVSRSRAPFIQPFDPRKGAMREYSTLIDVASLLSKPNVPWMPVEMIRHIYVGRMPKNPFRMRTYFFHFGGEKVEHPALAF